MGAVATSLAGLLGYVVVPTLTGAQPSFTAASISAVESRGLTHAVVLVGVPFTVSLVGTLFVRDRGFSGRRVDATVVGGVVLGPLVTVFLTYFVTAAAFGVAAGVRAGGVTDAVVVTVGFTAWALLFGVLVLFVAFPSVAVLETTAATAGDLCARGLWAAVENRRVTTTP